MKLNTTITLKDSIFTIGPSLSSFPLFACKQTDTTFQPRNGKGRLTVETSIAPFPNILKKIETIGTFINITPVPSTIKKDEITILLESPNSFNNQKLVNSRILTRRKTKENYLLWPAYIGETSFFRPTIQN